MHRKREVVAIATAAVAISVLLLAAFAGKDRIIEQWRLFQLEHGSRDDVLAAARWLGEKRCVGAVRPLLGAMKRACEEWLDGAPNNSARVAWFLIGPSSINPDHSPETLPPAWAHLEFLRAFSRIGEPAMRGMIRALLEEEDEITHRLAANILIRLLRSGIGSSFGGWVHYRDYGVWEVLPDLERLNQDTQVDPEVRRLAAQAFEKLAHRNKPPP